MGVLTVVGPPWRMLSGQAAATLLSYDRPALVAPDAWAVWSSSLKCLYRAEGPKMAMARAHLLAALGDGTAMVLKGAVRSKSGQWLFPEVEHRVEIDKALNALKPRDFQVLVAQARDRLTRAAGGAEGRALRAMTPNISEADWAALTEQEIGAIIDDVSADLLAIGSDARLVAAIDTTLGRSAVSVAESARAGQTLRVGGLSRADKELARNIGRRSGLFVTDEYGRRTQRWADIARRIVGREAAMGADSRAIAQRLTDALGNVVSGRTQSYFQIVANAAVSRARSFGEMSSYRDAQIEMYAWESVLDQRTTTICEFLHGQEFPVAASIARFAAADAAPTPQDTIDQFPWYSFSGGIVYAGQAGNAPPVAVGQLVGQRAEEIGQSTYTTLRSPADAGGSPVPPAHGMCRSQTIPVM